MLITMSEREFGRLLTEGIRHISLRESKPIQIVEDELGYAVGRSGSSAIQYWRKGHRPSRPSDIETLARDIARRGRVGPRWIERFLRSAGYANPESLCASLFPDQLTYSVPSPPTRLLGREHDLAAVRAKLEGGDVRLLTLTGAPGVGKTRLALQLAADLRNSLEHGIVFVPLASTRDPNRVLTVIAGALAIMDNNTQALEQRLKAFLRSQPMLLVLDNFEQVTSAAPLIGELLLVSPKLKVLVTSRERLRLYGEHEYPVLPLALPEPPQTTGWEAAARAPAVTLFVERAQALNPGFELTAANAATVAEICTRLDGLPLAIELIATRSKLLTPAEMLAQLGNRLTTLVGGPRDLPARQQTLQAAIAWSYELLNPADQQLFRRLGVFVGGFTLEAAEAVVGAECRPGLESLVDKNLVKPTRPQAPYEQQRFMMLETILEFAALKLNESGEAGEIRRRQARWFKQLAERAEHELRGPDQLIWLDQLEEEFPNIRAALAWSIEQRAEAENGLRLCAALYWFWNTRCHFSDEGRQWLDRFLASAREAADSPSMRHAQAKGLLTAGWLYSFPADIERAVALTEASLTRFKAVEDEKGVAMALINLGVYELARKNLDRAVTLAEEARTLCREINDLFGLAQVLNDILGPVATRKREYSRALALQEEALALRRELGDIDGIAWSLFQLAGVKRHQNEFARAQRYYHESRAYSRQIKNRRLYALAGEELAHIALAEGGYDLAQSHFEESLAVFESLGDWHSAAWMQVNLGRAAKGRGAIGPAITHYEQGLAAFRLNTDTLCSARVLAGLSMHVLATGDFEQARTLAEEGLALFTTLERRMNIAEMRLRLARIARHAGDYAQARSHLAEASPLVQETNYPALNVLYLIEAAGLALSGDPKRAAVLAGGAQAGVKPVDRILESDDWPECERIVSAARTALGEVEFEKALAEGKVMTPGELSAIAATL